MSIAGFVDSFRGDLKLRLDDFGTAAIEEISHHFNELLDATPIFYNKPEVSLFCDNEEEVLIYTENEKAIEIIAHDYMEAGNYKLPFKSIFLYLELPFGDFKDDRLPAKVGSIHQVSHVILVGGQLNFHFFTSIDGNQFQVKPYLVKLKSENGEAVVECIGPDNDPDEELIRFLKNIVMMDCFVLSMLENDMMIPQTVTHPPKLNKKRKKHSKPTVPQYKILKLGNNRSSSGQETGEGSKQRFHYRRGHWRHYNHITSSGSSRVRIPPCMAGNPELGIIIKDYEV